ncbi:MULTISPECIES: hypothetical protein [Paenibacillus]|uniref:hypothetical protein n=1 Tax=Paenibacillus TaxID=44249 RepID=UPI0030099093
MVTSVHLITGQVIEASPETPVLVPATPIRDGSNPEYDPTIRELFLFFINIYPFYHCFIFGFAGLLSGICTNGTVARFFEIFA